MMTSIALILRGECEETKVIGESSSAIHKSPSQQTTQDQPPTSSNQQQHEIADHDFDDRDLAKIERFVKEADDGRNINDESLEKCESDDWYEQEEGEIRPEPESEKFMTEFREMRTWNKVPTMIVDYHIIEQTMNEMFREWCTSSFE